MLTLFVAATLSFTCNSGTSPFTLFSLDSPARLLLLFYFSNNLASSAFKFSCMQPVKAVGKVSASSPRTVALSYCKELTVPCTYTTVALNLTDDALLVTLAVPPLYSALYGPPKP